MSPSIDLDGIGRARAEAAPPALHDALGETPAYLVGGAVRDAVLGKSVGDVDIAVEGELDPVLDRLGIGARTHERFGTATVIVDGRRIDLARTRRERYPVAGALPEVEPAPIRTDLARRDFTVNAMAVPLQGEPELLDPYGGRDDVAAGLLRVLHDRSFRDDPTRALRAARYVVRLRFRLEPHTERLLRAADLGTVSADRVEADLARIAAEPDAIAAFELLAGWGLLELERERLSLLQSVSELTRIEPWAGAVDRERALLDVVGAGRPRLELARQLAAIEADRHADSELFERAGRCDDGLLLIARAMGALWLDDHLTHWRRVRLRITGADLLAAGVGEGPELGAALRKTLHARIDGRLEAGAEPELEFALSTLRSPG
jgi:tRNA nucleotidyltransferase (CCA-adding enzyme)